MTQHLNTCFHFFPINHIIYCLCKRLAVLVDLIFFMSSGSVASCFSIPSDLPGESLSNYHWRQFEYVHLSVNFISAVVFSVFSTGVCVHVKFAVTLNFPTESSWHLICCSLKPRVLYFTASDVSPGTVWHWWFFALWSKVLLRTHSCGAG